MPTPTIERRRSRAVGEQQGGVLGRGGGLEAQRADAEPLERSVAPRGAPRSTQHDDVPGLAQHRGAGQVVAVAGHHDDVGRWPGARARASAPRSTADQDGALLAHEGLDAAQLLLPARGSATATTTGRPAIAVAVLAAPRGRASSRSCSRRRNSVLLCVKLSSCAARPLRAASISERRRRRSSSRPCATSVVAGVAPTPPSMRTCVAVLEPVEDLGADAVDHQDARLDEQLGPRLG